MPKEYTDRYGTPIREKSKARKAYEKSVYDARTALSSSYDVVGNRAKENNNGLKRYSNNRTR